MRSLSITLESDLGFVRSCGIESILVDTHVVVNNKVLHTVNAFQCVSPVCPCLLPSFQRGNGVLNVLIVVVCIVTQLLATHTCHQENVWSPKFIGIVAVWGELSIESNFGYRHKSHRAMVKGWQVSSGVVAVQSAKVWVMCSQCLEERTHVLFAVRVFEYSKKVSVSIDCDTSTTIGEHIHFRVQHVLWGHWRHCSAFSVSGFCR